jgi:hypothetical protein
MVLHLPGVLVKKKEPVLKNVSKSLRKVKFKMRFNGENKSFNVEFIRNNNLIIWTSISVENYTIMFSGLPF